MEDNSVPNRNVSDIAWSSTLSDSEEMNLTNDFKHDPLDHERVSIRVIRVLPTRSEQGYIQCTMRHTDIEDQYECLSYVWGDPSSKHHRILINGRVFWVRDNLWNFLSVAASESRHHSFDLWIDAICIDQDNVLERNHQVRYMGKIYKSAVGIIAWFGTDPDVTEFIGAVRKDPGMLGELYKEEHYRTASAYRNFQRTAVYTGLQSLTEAAYWRRAWITQEIVLARSILFASGHQCIVGIGEEQLSADLHHSRSVVSSYLANIMGTLMRDNPVIRLSEHLEVRQDARRGLVDLVGCLSHKECQIARDKIYSVLALTLDGEDLRPDYEASDEDVLSRALECSRSAWCVCEMYRAASIFKQIDHRAMSTHFIEFTTTIEWRRRWSGPLEFQILPELNLRLCKRCNNVLPHDSDVQGMYTYAICTSGICAEYHAHLLFKIPVLEGDVTVRAYEPPGGRESHERPSLAGVKINMQDVSTRSASIWNIQMPLQEFFIAGSWQWSLRDVKRACGSAWTPGYQVKRGQLDEPLSRESAIRFFDLAEHVDARASRFVESLVMHRQKSRIQFLANKLTASSYESPKYLA